MIPSARASFPLPPGSAIGILGSGQLGRMLALAAARLGFKCHIYADGRGPACDVAAATTIAPYDDFARLDAFTATVSVVTYEFENVLVDTAHHLETLLTVRPGSKALAIAQDRLAEKTFIQNLGIPVAPFTAVEAATDVERAMQADASPKILKTRRLGYDGKGQVSIDAATSPDAAFAAIGSAPAVLETRLSFKRELSVLACRAADGSCVFYDSPENRHADGILRTSSVPAPGLDAATIADAQRIAQTIAQALDYVGLLAVELFDLGPTAAPGGRLIVNEIAPRVHNSGHWTIDACAVSQFENHIRAVAGWPLGDPRRHSDAVMQNLIGGDVHAWPQLAAEPGACVHLYGKHDARPGRKMGHVTRLRPLTPSVLPRDTQPVKMV